MDPDRKLWNEQQKLLRQALTRSGDHQAAMDLFLRQHATLHAPEMAEAGLFSFEQSLWTGMPQAGLREIPPGEVDGHSIAWIIWHMARIEDVTMNLLVAGSPQVLDRDGWLDHLKISNRDTGNAMPGSAVVDLSASIDIAALRAYRLAVGRRTREVALDLRPDQLKQKVDPSRLRQVTAEGAVVEAASDLLDYWGGLTIAGLLLMPPTRHNFVHLNEAWRVKPLLIKTFSASNK